MNIPGDYVFGSDSMYLVIASANKNTAAQICKNLIKVVPEFEVHLAFALGNETIKSVNGKTIKNNLDTQPMSTKTVFEIDKEICTVAGSKLVEWYKTANTTVKSSVDILTKDQAATLGG